MTAAGQGILLEMSMGIALVPEDGMDSRTIWISCAHQMRRGRTSMEPDILSSEVQRSALQDLVNLGVGLAMDDLCSGYSALQRL